MKIRFYKNEEKDFVIERLNDFNHSFTKEFITIEGLLEYLGSMPESFLKMNEIEIEENVELIVPIKKKLSEKGIHR